MEPSPSIGLVLGAGGVAGAAWHAAVLAALAEVGWDARGAELVVGTSAGAGTAAALRSGVPPADLLAGSLGRPMSDVGTSHARRAGGPTQIPPPGVGGRVPWPAAPLLTLRTLARPWRFRPMVAVTGLLPEGRVPTGFLGDRIRRTHDGAWPERPTWICAVRLADGERVVFGREVDDTDLATAVEASSAIPGFFTPVDHGGHTYVDGGVHSPTNADLVAGLGFDLVVVSSPMSATGGALRRLRWSRGRGMHTARLAREVRAVRDTGTPVLALQPGPEVVDAVGVDAMDPTRRREVAEVAHDTVSAHLRSERVGDRLAVLTGAHIS